MRPGLDADDIYIMVEDEFHAIAQSYTQHLHHAEYKRLKEIVKAKHAGSIEKILRPVAASGTKGLSKDRQVHRAHKEMAERRDEAFEKIGAKGKDTSENADQDWSDEDADPNVVRDDDPWIGTMLQDLMTHQPNNPSLVGLQGITANTKASRGFRPESSARWPRRKGDASNAQGTKSAMSTAEPEIGSDEETASDTDDLDKPVRSQKAQVKGKEVENSKAESAKLRKNRKVFIEEPDIMNLESSRGSPAVPNSRSLYAHGNQRGILKHTQTPVNDEVLDEIMRPTPLVSRRARLQSQKKANVDNDTSVDEIPVFLV